MAVAKADKTGQTGKDGEQSESRQILAQARQGDTQAFQSLYELYSGRVYAVCLRMTGDCGLAEDCTQEAFIKAWRKLSSFRGDSAFGTWLHRIAVNEVLTMQRRSGREIRYLEAVGETRSAERSEKAGDTLDIESAILKLPVGARNVFVLCGIHGYQHNEAAEFLGLAPGTCKAQLHRARRLLKMRLEA
ncbi:MAG: RNA polymerase sigma factor [Gammaproteobacteria bacterium]|nr:RNA polymerase sigma factor [Gammaproteobacteria bacterium]